MRSPSPLVALIAAALLSACASPPGRPMNGRHAAPEVRTPFAPAALRIHPLTRVDRDARGAVWIFCHVEMRDAWGDTCKATGKLQVQLYRPVGGRTSGLGTQESTWDVDLADLNQNAALFDPATRTYRLPLENVPAWVAELLDPANRETRVRLRAVLTSQGPDGEPRVLQDEFSIGG